MTDPSAPTEPFRQPPEPTRAYARDELVPGMTTGPDPEPLPAPRVRPVRPGRPVRVTQLVMGLVFLGLALVWLLGSTGTIDPTEVGQWLPAVLIVAGVTGLVVSTLDNRARRHSRHRDGVYVDPIDPTDPMDQED